MFWSIDISGHDRRFPFFALRLAEGAGIAPLRDGRCITCYGRLSIFQSEMAFTLIGMIITIPAVMLIGLAALILPIIGIVEATQGRSYKYPIAIAFIK
jgi:hypothetical protein